MKDVTSSSFGLVIAFLLPGLTAFYSLGFYFASVREVFKKFLEVESGVGLFFIVLLIGLALGLVVSNFRWVLYEVILGRVFQVKKLDLSKLANDDNKLASFRAVVDEHYRYHQFSGGMSLIIPILYLGWFMYAGTQLTNGSKSLTIGIVILIEGVTIYAAWDSWKRYVDRANVILK